ncbi:hypothetical protein Gohar_018650 [Gossypium harknessii]|uniref:Uncharacterized protein n=1 Tax=Gossypium harknessii TaxID=34285 RepID=A0A7J9GBV1_9ROSI|nr:hypothetical protein [Gossypium harknessii]
MVSMVQGSKPIQLHCWVKTSSFQGLMIIHVQYVYRNIKPKRQ